MKFIMYRFGARFLISILIISFVSIDHVSFIDCLPLSRVKRAFSYIANETACTVDHIIYKDGDPIPTDDPCETCRCRPPGFTCILRHCEVKSGCRAIRRIGECCPSYQCGCEHNGQYFKDGDRIHNAESPCYSCYCQGSSITCSLADCQFRFDCEPEYVVGECCPRYDHCPSPPPSSTSVKIPSPTRRTSATTNSSMAIINETVAAITAKNQDSVELSTTESLNSEISSSSPGIPSQVTTSSSLILDDDTPFQLRFLPPQTNHNPEESRQQETIVPSTITTVAPDLTVQSEKTTTEFRSVQDLPETTTEFPIPESTIIKENSAKYDLTSGNVTASITEIPLSYMMKINYTEDEGTAPESNSTGTTTESGILSDSQTEMSKFSQINYKKLEDSIEDSLPSMVTTTQNPIAESYANSENVVRDFSNNSTTPSSLDSNEEKTDNYYFITTEESVIREEDDPPNRIVEEVEAEKTETLFTDKPDTPKTNGTEQSVRQDDDREPVTETVKEETLSSADIASIKSIESTSTESISGLVETTTMTPTTASANN